jgi:hypothetical protein
MTPEPRCARFVDAAGHPLKKTGTYWHHDKRFKSGRDSGYSCPCTRFAIEHEEWYEIAFLPPKSEEPGR